MAFLNYSSVGGRGGNLSEYIPMDWSWCEIKTFYLAEQFRQATFYLVELFRQIAFSILEINQKEEQG